MTEPATYGQRKRVKGWRMPAGSINCTRDSRGGFGKWGNPFPVDGIVVRDAAHAVELYRDFLTRRMPWKVTDARRELAGKVLLCWCRPGAPCHVQDVLIPLVNEPIGAAA